MACRALPSRHVGQIGAHIAAIQKTGEILKADVGILTRPAPEARRKQADPQVEAIRKAKYVVQPVFSALAQRVEEHRFGQRARREEAGRSATAAAVDFPA